MTLTPLKAKYWQFDRIPYEQPEYEPDPETISDEEGPQRGDDEDEDDFWERRYEWKESVRRVVQPEPGDFRPPHVRDHMTDEYYKPGTEDLLEEMKVDLRREYGHRGLQVIVKLANIELTPEKPEYEGGTWHVEGQLVSPPSLPLAIHS